MNDPRYSEEEQVERLKEWWKKNGTSVIVGVAIGVSAIVGVNYWRDYTRAQSEGASALYMQLLSIEGADSKQLGSELMSDYSDTPYAELAALYLAKINYEAGDMDGAESMLRWAMDNARLASNQHAARLRLARVYLDTGRTAEAEQLAGAERYDGFESEYKELMGDIAMLKGDADKARSNYEEALSALPDGSNYSGLLVLKLDRAIGASVQ